MDYNTFVGSRLDHHRAIDLARESELRRSIAERGAIRSRRRPVVDVIARLGVWLQASFTDPPRPPAATVR